MSNHAKGFDTRLKGKTRNAEIEESIERSRNRRIMRRGRHVIKGYMVKFVIHEWTLWRGDFNTNRRIRATPAQIHELNVSFERRFMAQDHNDASIRLWKWKLVDRDECKRVRYLVTDRFVDCMPTKKEFCKFMEQHGYSTTVEGPINEHTQTER